MTIVICIAGTGLRFFHLGIQSLWFDEGYSAWVASLAPCNIVDAIRADTSPPLYYLLLWQWRALFGESEWALRSLSALAGSAALPVVAAIAWRLTRQSVPTLVAASLFALTVMQVQYSQEVRGYAVAASFALAAFYGVIRRFDTGRRWLLLTLLASVAACYIHSIFWFYFAALHLAYLFSPGQPTLRKRLGELVILDGLALLAYLPWLTTFREQMAWTSQNFWTSTPSPDLLGRTLFVIAGIKARHLSAVLGDVGWVQPLLTVALLALPALLLFPGRHSARDARRWTFALLSYALAPILVAFVYSQFRQSIFLQKVFLASSFALPLLVALALASPSASPRRRLALPVVGVLLAGMSISLYGYFAWEKKEDWRSAITHVNSLATPNTLIVFVANEGELLYDYYLRQTGSFASPVQGLPQGFFELTPHRTLQHLRSPADLKLLDTRLAELKPRRVILVYSHWQYADPDRLTANHLAAAFTLRSSRDFYYLDVLEYGQ